MQEPILCATCAMQELIPCAMCAMQEPVPCAMCAMREPVPCAMCAMQERVPCAASCMKEYRYGMGIEVAHVHVPCRTASHVLPRLPCASSCPSTRRMHGHTCTNQRREGQLESFPACMRV
eukprot:365291-Chlamydomonas_euryale.AAC.15